MRPLFRPAILYLLSTYLLLSAMPFVPLLMGKPLEHPMQMLGVELLAWIAAWAVFKRPAWFHFLLLPAFLAVPTELYLFTFYGQGISTHHLGIIAETSPREALEFLGKKVWAMLAVMLAVLFWWWSTWRVARRTRELDWGDYSRWITLALLLTGAGLWGYGEKFGVNEPPSASASAGEGASAAESAGVAQAAGSATASASAAVSTAAVSMPADTTSAGATSTASMSADAKDAIASASDAPNAPSAKGLPRGWASHLPPLPHWAGMPFDLAVFSRSWPFGVTARGIDFYNERKYLADLSRRNSDFKFNAKQDGDTPQTVIVVIGESSRFDRWSLNGYERETNPLLKQESNLVMLRDVITSVSATRLSVPVIVSRKPATQSLKDGFNEKSFLTAYKEAGFKTYWLSNQISFGEFDTPVSVFAKEADVVQFMNLGGFTDNSNFDEVLFDPLAAALADPSPKKLIVLHTLGSHWNYSHRYPATFDKWKPSLLGVDKPVYTDTAIKPQLNNSYDNAILYTDWFLAQVIAKLKDTQALTSMLYVADHGQTLYDNSCNLAFHGHNTQYEFHVPALMWYSDKYLAAYPDKIARLRKNSKARLATENMFHSLLDIANIRYPGDRLEWSFVNARFKQHKRYVDSYGWTNYDNATLKGDCREVIDKAKPLAQD